MFLLKKKCLYFKSNFPYRQISKVCEMNREGWIIGVKKVTENEKSFELITEEAKVY